MSIRTRRRIIQKAIEVTFWAAFCALAAVSWAVYLHEGDPMMNLLIKP